jgi:hypothetical protein
MIRKRCQKKQDRSKVEGKRGEDLRAFENEVVIRNEQQPATIWASRREGYETLQDGMSFGRGMIGKRVSIAPTCVTKESFSWSSRSAKTPRLFPWYNAHLKLPRRVQSS